MLVVVRFTDPAHPTATPPVPGPGSGPPAEAASGQSSASGSGRSPGDDAATVVTRRARQALEAFAQRPGYLGGVLGRSLDDPAAWTLTMRWDSVGAYRRALSSWDVKLRAHPLLYEADDEPTAFEVLLEVDADGVAVERPSDRAPAPADGR